MKTNKIYLIPLVTTFLFSYSLNFAENLSSNKTDKNAPIKNNWNDLNRNGKKDIYEMSDYSVNDRVSDLLSKMTLEEKVGQMCQYIGWRDKSKPTDVKNEDLKVNYEFSVGNAAQLVEEGKIGSFLFVENQDDCNFLQKASFKSRLGIPVLMAIDAIHGNGMTTEGGTIYPTEIGIASSFDTKMAEQIAKFTAKEMRSIGYHWTFSPNIEVVYNTRWGRCGETFGEDPFLVGKMGAAMIRGYQGDDLSRPDNVLACAKHFAGGGIANNAFNGSPADISERTLFEEIFPPFQDALDEKVFTIMPAHNELNGIPCHMHKKYLTNLLRKDWGFDGFYVSDWMDLEKLYTIQKTVSSVDEAYEKSVNAGLDVHMHGPNFYESVIEHVKAGRIPEARINDAAKKILEAKFRLGLFEERLTTKHKMQNTVMNSEHEKLALEAAHKSIVLLKNEKNILPLNKQRKRIFVTGTLADNQSILGDWAVPRDDKYVTTILEGIRKSVGKDCKVDYLDAGSIFNMKDNTIKKAKKMARKSDIVVVVVGENGQRNQNPNYQTLGENIDRSVTHLRGKQLELIKTVEASGKPVILVLVNGAPISTEWSSKNVEVIIEAWEPGAKGGEAVADIIFGKVNPSARLPFTIGRSVGHLNDHYKNKPSSHARGGFLDTDRTPLYEFGFGLSYTSFKYSNIQIQDTITSDSDLKFSLNVTNTGNVDGEEVVLIFLNDVISSIATPVKELCAFKRVHLKAGETKKLSFSIENKHLSFLDADMKRIVEPGEFELFMGVKGAAYTETKFYVVP